MSLDAPGIFILKGGDQDGSRNGFESIYYYGRYA